MRLGKKILTILGVATLTLVGCKYDDSDLWKSIEGLETRMDLVEKQLAKINGDVTSLQTLVNALNSKLYVSSVTSTGTGYVLLFSDGTSVLINNGQDGMTPYVGFNGNWWVGQTDTGVKAAGQDGKDGQDGLTPYVGTNGNWWIGQTDTGVRAAAQDGGGAGLTPFVGANGNWWIGNTDTGVHAAAVDGKDGKDGVDGQTPHIGENGNWWLGDTDTGVAAKMEAGTSNYPIITVVADGGVYYWAQVIDGNVQFLFDSNGNRIEVGGGSVSYVAPLLKVDLNGYWVISYDNGKTWNYIRNEKGDIFVYGSGSTGGSECHCGIVSVQVNGSVVYITLIDGTVLEFGLDGGDGYVDPRLDDVVPKEIRDKMGGYMTIYNGINPPNIEGAYAINPMTCVYCEDQGHGGYDPGKVVNSEDIRLSHQDNVNNTIDFEMHSEKNSNYQTSTGAFVSGNGNNFTVFFNTNGYSSGAYIKTALLISGTKTSVGIANLRYAFVMVDDGGDPNDDLMEEGVFRVFRDGDELCDNITWTWGDLMKSKSNQPFDPSKRVWEELLTVK